MFCIVSLNFRVPVKKKMLNTTNFSKNYIRFNAVTKEEEKRTRKFEASPLKITLKIL